MNSGASSKLTLELRHSVKKEEAEHHEKAMDEDSFNEPHNTMKREVLILFAQLCAKAEVQPGAPGNAATVVHISEYLTSFWGAARKGLEEARLAFLV